MKYLLIILILFFSHSGLTQDYSLPGVKISPLFYWIEDKDQVHTVAEALKVAEWAEVEGEFNLGYSYQSAWFMQNIQAYDKGDWIFQVPYPLLDYLDLYLYRDDELIEEIHTGDAVPYTEKALRVNDFILKVSAKEAGNYRLVGRIETEGTLILPIVWQAEKRFCRESWRLIK